MKLYETKKRGNFLARLFSSLILLPVIMACLIIGGDIFTILAYIMVILATLEVSTIISHQVMGIPVILSIIYAVIITFALVNQTILIAVGVIIGGAVLLALSAWLLWKPQHFTLRQVIALIFATIYAGFFGAAMILLRDSDYGLFLWVLIINGAWTTDTLAYAGGSFYGRTPMVPRLSPNKTIEGALTGLFFGFVIGLVFLVVWDMLQTPFILIVILAPFSAQAGDLMESAFKRAYQAKDSHFGRLNIVPGHGGIVDRIDSLSMVVFTTFAVALVFDLL